MADLQQAREAKQHLRAQLREVDGVTGIGLARAGDDYRLQVNVVEPAVGSAVPTSVDGVSVRVRLTGPVTASATA